MSQKQRLELTWVGKDEQPKLEPRILIEDPDKSYGNKSSENMLIYGDNLLALKALEQDFTGKIKCIYIDPPYNTGSAWEHFDDSVEQSLWLDLMYARLRVLHKLLSPDGCIFTHIDNSEQAHLKVMLDEIFGRSNFITTFLIQVRHAGRMLKGDKDIHDVVEYVHCYQKSNLFEIAKKQKEEKENEFEEYIYSVKLKSKGKLIKMGSKEVLLYKENEYEIQKEACTEKLFKKINIRGGLREGNSSGRFYVAHLENRIEQDGYNVLYKVPDMGDDHLGCRFFLARENAEKKNGNYFQGVPLTRISSKELPYPSFFDFSAEFNRVGYEGVVAFRNSKKPEALIKHFLDIANTKDGDWVLDSFLGSGTTVAVAHKLNRKWIGVELGEQCHTHCIPRLKSVVDGKDQAGISEVVQWKGGGGFRYYFLAPSLLKKDKYNNWVIDERYNPTMLAAAMAKHEGFKYCPDETLYWKQGQSTEKDFILTTTGFITVEHLTKIKEDMKPDESLLICCKSFQEACVSRFPNITVKKIPNMLLGSCEFGKEDYSLNIVNMPVDDDADSELDEEADAKQGKKEAKKKIKKVASKNQTDLFTDSK